MKISQENIDKICERIANLNDVLNDIDNRHPSNITCAMGASINSLSRILDEIDLGVKIKSKGYLTFEQFEDWLLKCSNRTYAEYCQYRKEVKLPTETDKKFYKHRIDYINKNFVTKL